MKYRHIYILIAISVLSAAGCRRYDSEEILLPRNDISLTIKGETIMEYDKNFCQTGYNDERQEFRVLDNRLADWFLIRCAQVPSSVGQAIKADLEYTTSDNIRKMNGLTFTVMKMNKEGMVWMWEDDKDIGIVIKLL